MDVDEEDGWGELFELVVGGMRSPLKQPLVSHKAAKQLQSLVSLDWVEVSTEFKAPGAFRCSGNIVRGRWANEAGFGGLLLQYLGLKLLKQPIERHARPRPMIPRAGPSCLTMGAMGANGAHGALTKLDLS